jgi:hypothetical protein
VDLKMIRNKLKFKNLAIITLSALSFSGINEKYFKSKTTFYCKNTEYNQRLLNDKNIKDLRQYIPPFLVSSGYL